MKGKEDQHSRLCVLESLFTQFQQQAIDRMEMEESSLSEIKVSIKEVISHIDQAQKEHWMALDAMKGETLNTIEKEYPTKVKVNEDITAMRASIIADIEKSQKDTVKQFSILFGIVIIVCGAFGWLYVNVAIPNANHHALTMKSKTSKGMDDEMIIAERDINSAI